MTCYGGIERRVYKTLSPFYNSSRTELNNIQPLYSLSPLEQSATSYSKDHTTSNHSNNNLESKMKNEYTSTKISTYFCKENAYATAPLPEEKIYFQPSTFLNHNAPIASFVGKAEDLKDLAEETFLKTTGRKLPKNMIIKICSHDEMKRSHGESFDSMTTGFCINHQGKKFNEIFVLEGNLDRVMVTLGHEIGHALSNTLDDAIDEEAKAFAFCLEWMKTIKEHNIGDLSMNINLNPAKNGVHNKALDFVLKLIEQGTRAFEVFENIIRGSISHNQLAD